MAHFLQTEVTAAAVREYRQKQEAKGEPVQALMLPDHFFDMLRYCLANKHTRYCQQFLPHLDPNRFARSPLPFWMAAMGRDPRLHRVLFRAIAIMVGPVTEETSERAEELSQWALAEESTQRALGLGESEEQEEEQHDLDQAESTRVWKLVAETRNLPYSPTLRLNDAAKHHLTTIWMNAQHSRFPPRGMPLPGEEAVPAAASAAGSSFAPPANLAPAQTILDQHRVVLSGNIPYDKSHKEVAFPAVQGHTREADADLDRVEAYFARGGDGRLPELTADIVFQMQQFRQELSHWVVEPFMNFFQQDARFLSFVPPSRHLPPNSSPSLPIPPPSPPPRPASPFPHRRARPMCPTTHRTALEQLAGDAGNREGGREG